MNDHRKTTDPELYRVRHSLSHVMAQAVLQIRPGSKLGFGPPVDDGFYYDFLLPQPLTEADFPEIEKRMREIIKQNQSFSREDLDVPAALKRIDEMGEPYKREYARDLSEKQGLTSLSFYRNGPFLDMCEGPHVESTGKIPRDCFKLKNLAGAYWRGDSHNAMMTRIYAWAFPTKEELDRRVKAYQEAQARDHKKLGKELEIFVIDDEIGRGLPLWLPNGTVVRDEIQKLMTELEFKAGYRRVATPHLAKAELYHKTGHLPYYQASMYPFLEVREKRESDKGTIEEVRETYVLKPMNCPHHHRIFASKPRSYRDLPLRLAEYGQVYRFEDSGAVSGLLRVRGMCMNDAHIYCTEEQIRSEFVAVMEMHRKLYDILGLKDYYLRFSTWNPDDPKGREKYVDNPPAWQRSQEMILDAMKETGLEFVEGRGEAAFYGPKIDVQFRTVTGREETMSTNQLDFAVPGRLGLKYIGPDNKECMPYVIHRAPAGTHERIVAFLIEHYGGAFPTWMAPVQTLVITVSDKFNAYGQSIVDDLRARMVRAELDESRETVGKKIRTAVKAKIPNVLVVGEKEQAEGSVTLRRFGSEEQKVMPSALFREALLASIVGRTRELTLI